MQKNKKIKLTLITTPFLTNSKIARPFSSARRSFSFSSLSPQSDSQRKTEQNKQTQNAQTNVVSFFIFSFSLSKIFKFTIPRFDRNVDRYAYRYRDSISFHSSRKWKYLTAQSVLAQKINRKSTKNGLLMLIQVFYILAYLPLPFLSFPDHFVVLIIFFFLFWQMLMVELREMMPPSFFPYPIYLAKISNRFSFY